MYVVKSTDELNISLSETDEVKSILQNVAIILKTWQGENPAYREFGINSEAMHKPVNVAEQLLRSSIIEAIEKYEPRAKIQKISFENNSPDGLIKIVELEV